MGLPSDTGDIKYYAGDPLTLKCDFTTAGVGLDVSASAWTATLHGGEFAIDTTDAVIGIVRLVLTPAQTKALPPMARWDLAEVGRWGRTVIKGRLIKEGDV
jgi:hypothetical protein